ncbi:MAG TPA: hypothetical protein PKE29_15425 [Phycisphaerales bacterium]|nr:hypothetical protein [Phycisphaerales bacterium]
MHPTSITPILSVVGVPAPMAVFPWGVAGWKHSFYGDLHASGEDAAKFYTESKVIVARWL